MSESSVLLVNILDRLRQVDFSHCNGYEGVASMEDISWKIRTLALRDLLRLGDAGALEAMPLLLDLNSQVRRLVVMAEGIQRYVPAAEALAQVLKNDPVAEVRVAAVEAIGQLAVPLAKEWASEAEKNDPHWDVRKRSQLTVRRLKESGPEQAEVAAAWSALEEADFSKSVLGQAAPDFELKDTDGNSWKLSDFKGKKPVALIWVFAEWCPVCHGEFNELLEMKENYQKAGVQVLTIECHDAFRSKAMVGDREIWWPHLVDNGAKVGLTYGVDPMEFTVHEDWINRPCTFLVDKEGILRFAYKGTFFGDRPTVAQTLEMITAKNYKFEHPDRRK